MNNIITKIEVQKRNKDRVNVYVDNEFNFACDLELIYLYNLKKDMQVDLDKIREVVLEDNYLKAKECALKTIEKTYKTESQIREKLLKKEYSINEIDRVIDFLKKYGFLDDYKYVKMFIHDNINKIGKNKMKFDLLKKGIDENLILDELNNISYETEFNSAYEIFQKKYKVLKKGNDDQKKLYKKLGDFLIRKGFDFSIINEIIGKFKEDEVEVLNHSDDFDCGCEDENRMENLLKLAQKRYNIILKSENDYVKIYRRLASYLMRRGYSYEEVKRTINDLEESR